MEFIVLGLVNWGVMKLDINEKVHSLDIQLYNSLNIRLRFANTCYPSKSFSISNPSLFSDLRK